jgi:hypothetical protein
VRVHWMPYFLPMEAVTSNLVQLGCKVVSATMDKATIDELKHCSSNPRSVLVETDQPTRIPHFIDWVYHGMAGRVMLTMTGRKTTCLRCALPRHIRKNCNTAYCRRCRNFGHDMGNCRGGSWAGVTRQDQPTYVDLIEEDEESLLDAAVAPVTGPTSVNSTTFYSILLRHSISEMM